ncbi:MAG: hypothetical protein AAF203_04375 [Pseudomonadota bacterium]
MLNLLHNALTPAMVEIKRTLADPDLVVSNYNKMLAARTASAGPGVDSPLTPSGEIPPEVGSPVGETAPADLKAGSPLEGDPTLGVTAGSPLAADAEAAVHEIDSPLAHSEQTPLEIFAEYFAPPALKNPLSRSIASVSPSSPVGDDSDGDAALETPPVTPSATFEEARDFYLREVTKKGVEACQEPVTRAIQARGAEDDMNITTDCKGKTKQSKCGPELVMHLCKVAFATHLTCIARGAGPRRCDQQVRTASAEDDDGEEKPAPDDDGEEAKD